MSLLSKLTAYGKKFKHAGGVKHLDPARDWLLLLLVGAVLLAGSIGWNLWFFFVALNEENTNQTMPAERKLDTSALEKARVLFEARATEEEKYKTEYQFNDPSK